MNQLLWVLPLVQQVPNPPAPDESTPTAQLVSGLGLSATMLAGFLIIIAIAAVALLVLAWMRRDAQTV